MCRYDEKTSMGGEQVVLDLPDFIRPDKESRTVSIDKCIVDVIKALWEEGIHTLGCCCGHHGRFEDGPTVIISGSDIIDVAKIVILENDNDRHWSILQWKLTEVART